MQPTEKAQEQRSTQKGPGGASAGAGSGAGAGAGVGAAGAGVRALLHAQDELAAAAAANSALLAQLARLTGELQP